MTAFAGETRWATAVIEDVGVDLLRYFARRAPSEDVDDLLNGTLTVVSERRSALPRDLVEARMWSFGVARNTLRSHQRRHSKQARLADALRSVAGIAPVGAHRRDPSEELEARERNADIHAALDGLRERDRELVILVHWDGFTLAQAAALLGVNPSTARTRYARAKERLAAQLEQHRSTSSRMQKHALPDPLS